MERVVILLLAAILSGCATSPPRVAVHPPPAGDVFQQHPLDVRFAEVRLERVRIQDAIHLLAREVKQVYGEKYAFSPAFQSATDPMMERPLRDPFVSFHGTDVTARAVFDELCRQAGWSYEWTVKHFIMFQDGPSDDDDTAHPRRKA